MERRNFFKLTLLLMFAGKTLIANDNPNNVKNYTEEKEVDLLDFVNEGNTKHTDNFLALDEAHSYPVPDGEVGKDTPRAVFIDGIGGGEEMLPKMIKIASQGNRSDEVLILDFVNKG